jgi:hypothetical protein
LQEEPGLWRSVMPCTLVLGCGVREGRTYHVAIHVVTVMVSGDSLLGKPSAWEVDCAKCSRLTRNASDLG